MEKVLWLMEHVKSDLQNFLVLLMFWPNNPLLWGCLMHWKPFSSIPGLSTHQQPTAGDSPHTKNTRINEVISENEKHVFYFMEKTKQTFWPTQYIDIYSYYVFPRKQRNWRFVYLASINFKYKLPASVTEGSILISHWLEVHVMV